MLKTSLGGGSGIILVTNSHVTLHTSLGRGQRHGKREIRTNAIDLRSQGESGHEHPSPLSAPSM
jgi:S-adenosylmethionine/arginine decarboxylase-like enzyme